MLPYQFTVRLDGFRRKVKKWYCINGLSLFLIAVSLFSIITFIFDWFIPDLPKAVRIFFLLIGFISGLYILIQHLIYPVTKKISDDDIAVSLENYYPYLKGRLVSSLQLAKDVKNDEKFNSSKLVSKLVADTGQLVDNLDMDGLISLFSIKRVLLILCGLLFVIVMYTGFHPMHAGIWFNRILGGELKWPKKTLLKVIVKNTVIPKGQDFNIEVVALKGFPGKVSLYYETSDGENNFGRMTKTSKDRFRFNFPRIQNSFRFFAEGGDDKTEWTSITTVTPPDIEQIKLWYEYPEYTKINNTAYDKPEIGGIIKAPFGTKVRISLFANIPVDSAELKIHGKKLLDKIDLKIAYDKNDLREMHGSFFVTNDAEYSVTVKAKNGLENVETIRYPIKVVVDTAPTIKIIEPKIDIKHVTINATLPIALETTDDYGVQQIKCYHKISTRDPVLENEVFFTLQQNDNPYGSKKINTKYDCELNLLGVKEGDIVNYSFEAEDNCAVSSTNKTKTRVLKFIIVNEAVIQKRIEENQMRIKDEVRKTLNLQDNLKSELDKNKDFLSQTDKLGSNEQRNIQEWLAKQRRVTQVLERIKKEFDGIISDIAINKLWDKNAREKLESINSEIESVAKEKSPQAGDLLSNISTAPDLKERKSRLEKLSNGQEQIINDLHGVLSKMEEWEDYQEVIKIIKELMERQRKIIDSIKGKSE